MGKVKKLGCVCFLFFSGLIFGQSFTAMTYNIRLDIPQDGDTNWANRKNNMFALLDFYQPDIFGIQEGLPHQVENLKNALPAYSVLGEGRDGKNTGEHSSIFYNTNRFEVLQNGTFWLSETPKVVSKGWDAALNRICTYALFLDLKTQRKFWVFNTHFDHVGTVARENSVALIHETIQKYNTMHYPVVLMGDFNLEPDSSPIAFLKARYSDTKRLSKVLFNSGGTFNAFDFTLKKFKEIDYIFISKSGFNVSKYAVLNNHFSGIYPSDHFPVMVELKWK